MYDDMSVAASRLSILSLGDLPLDPAVVATLYSDTIPASLVCLLVFVVCEPRSIDPRDRPVTLGWWRLSIYPVLILTWEMLSQGIKCNCCMGDGRDGVCCEEQRAIFTIKYTPAP